MAPAKGEGEKGEGKMANVYSAAGNWNLETSPPRPRKSSQNDEISRRPTLCSKHGDVNNAHGRQPCIRARLAAVPFADS